MNTRYRQMFPLIAAALVVAAVLGAGVLVATRAGINYDEGYHLQVPLSLVTRGAYASTKDGAGLFDPYISPGPTLMLPIAASFSLFGVGLFQARLVMLLYLVAMLAFVWLVTGRLFGESAAAVALLVTACAPSSLVSGTTVLGETPGIAFLLAGVLALSDRSFRRAGLLIGLAALTKFVFFLALLPLAVCAATEIAAAPKDRRGQAARPYFWMAGLALIPSLVWEVVQIAILGLPAYFEHKFNFVSFLRGNAVSSAASAGVSHVSARLQTLGRSFGLSGVIVILVVAATLALGLSEIAARRRDHEDNRLNVAVRFLLLYSVLHLAWWLGSPNMGFWRYAFPGYVAAAPFAGGAFAWLLRRRSPAASWAAGAAALVLAACLILRPAAGEIRYLRDAASGRDLANQRLTAAYVEGQARMGTLFAYWGWWQAPEIQFLAGESFDDITRRESRRFLNREAAAGRRVLVILSPYQERFTPPPGNWVYVRKYCGAITRQIGGSKGWTLRRFIPDSDPVAQYRAAEARGDLAGMRTSVEPPAGKAAAAQIQSGFYDDGWMERRAGAWLGLPPGARAIRVSGDADLRPFDGAPVKLAVSVVGGPRVSAHIRSSGPFFFDVPVDEKLRVYRAVKVTIFSDRWYIPHDLDKKAPGAPAGLTGRLRSFLRGRLGLRIPDYRELTVRILKIQVN